MVSLTLKTPSCCEEKQMVGHFPYIPFFYSSELRAEVKSTFSSKSPSAGQVFHFFLWLCFSSCYASVDHSCPPNVPIKISWASRLDRDHYQGASNSSGFCLISPHGSFLGFASEEFVSFLPEQAGITKVFVAFLRNLVFLTLSSGKAFSIMYNFHYDLLMILLVIAIQKPLQNNSTK